MDLTIWASIEVFMTLSYVC